VNRHWLRVLKCCRQAALSWATYADHLVHIHVDNEQRLRPTKDEVEAGEGLIPRAVSVTVTETIWSRPGNVPMPPTTITWSSGGWVFHGNKEQRLQSDGVPWLDPGHDYLVPIAYTTSTPNSSEDPSWIPLGSQNAMPFDNGKIGNGEQLLIGGTPYNGRNPSGITPMRDAVWGMTGLTLSPCSARPDPIRLPPST
jgi:hypothetical protein